MSELYRRMKVSAGLAQQAFKSTVEEDEQVEVAAGGHRPRDAAALRAWLPPRKITRKGEEFLKS